MSLKARSYAAEYRRRIEKGLAKGLTRSAARGHPKAGEPGSRGPPKRIPEDRFQLALRTLRSQGSLTRAAKEAKIAPERLRYWASREGLIEKKGRFWAISSKVKRTFERIYSEGKIKRLTVDSFEDASLLGKHAAAVKRFLETNDRTVIFGFNGQYVHDVKGVKHGLETDPNILYQLSFSSDHAAEQIYRIHV